MKLTLEKLLQSQGFDTRKGCRRLIRHGALSIDGEVVNDPFAEVEAEGLSFELEGERWSYHERLYLALHKPAGYECSREPSHHASVFELLPPPYINRGVQPVGRLDADTTGLLLLTDDGAFNHALSSPKRHVAKTYEATITDEVTDELCAKLEAGVELHREPAPVRALSCRPVHGGGGHRSHSLELVLDQGKYHQVKRMLAAAGTRCEALHRSAIGEVSLTELRLEAGAFRLLAADDVARLRKG
jgi:16S rRNA pseudouridine516 synthase